MARIPQAGAGRQPLRSILFPALRPFPALKAALRRTRQGQLALRRVGGNDAAGTNRGAPANVHRRNQRRIGANESIVTYGGLMLVDAVIVAGNGTSPHVRSEERRVGKECRSRLTV